MSDHLNSVTFTTIHTMDQVLQHHWRDPTLSVLFRVVDSILSKEDGDTIIKSDTRYFLSQVKRNLKEIIEDNKNQGSRSKRKTISNAEKRLVSIKKIEKNLEDNDRSEGESNDPKQYTIEDATFVENFSKLRKTFLIKVKQMACSNHINPWLPLKFLLSHSKKKQDIK